jgi:predicted secreted Zn-dependent protease
MRTTDPQVYELVVRGRVGPLLEHVLQPCTVRRTEVVTVLRTALSGASVAELVRRFDERGWEVGRVALVG